MKKSIFSKYFGVYASLLLLSIVFLGSLFMMFSAQYFTSQKKELLQNNVEIVRKLITKGSVVDWENGVARFDTTLVQSSFDIFSEASSSEIFLTDLNGNTQFCTEGQESCNHYNHPVSLDIINKVCQDKEKSYFELGRLGGLYSTRYYTLGVPLTLSDTDVPIGCIFITTSGEGMSEFLQEMLRLFLSSSLIVLFLAFMVIYFASARMSRPLREMSKAVKRFGEGDYSSRIHVDTVDEIGELGTAFNQMAGAIASQETMRRSFIANVSHELRTPMTSIAGFVDGILDGTISQSEERHYLTLVSEEVKRLSRLVRSMLNLSRIEAGELKINASTFNITDTIIQTVLSFEKQIDAKHLDIVGLDAPKTMVEADADLIHQVIYNLTENAVKFVNEGGTLTFSLSNEGNFTSVSIKNTGEGLSRDELPKIFERFYKTDRSRGMDKNGVGLGLYIVRSIIQLHGGKISVRSTPGEFTEFIFTVPTAKIRGSSLTIGKEKDYPEKSDKEPKDEKGATESK